VDLPVAHSVHSEEPPDAEYVPGTHGEQDELVAAYSPASQAVQVAEPEELTLPESQTVHSSAASPEYVPGTHGEQDELVAAYLPASQAVQVAEPEELTLPESQTVHSSAASPEYVPGTHCAHVE
jgi:hypothetical protein